MTGQRKSERHNRLMREIMPLMAAPWKDGDDPEAVLVLLETVIAGTILLVTKFGRDEAVLDTVIEGVRGRLAAIRLDPIDPIGVA